MKGRLNLGVRDSENQAGPRLDEWSLRLTPMSRTGGLEQQARYLAYWPRLVQNSAPRHGREGTPGASNHHVP
jgi:hypothetical protein